MLQKLFIQNYAIIEELEIDFSGKMNSITGETGAGKSIIADALGLILGHRADSSVLINKEKKCIVESIFLAENTASIEKFKKENDFDFGEELILRREIISNGKSRAFINDTPVNLSQLQELSSLLVDLHQQFDELQLSENIFQREVIDALAGNGLPLKTYQEIYFSWKSELKELNELIEKKSQFDKEADYNRFQFSELEDADFKEQEIENIENELKTLNNAEGIKNALLIAYNELKDKELPIVQQIKILSNSLNSFAANHPSISNLAERLLAAHIELQDISDELAQLSNQINYDSEKIEFLNNRLSVGYKLFKKHGVQTTNELLEIQHQLQENLLFVLNLDETIQQKKKQAELLFEKATEKAKQIFNQRTQFVKPIEKQVNELLKRVGMPNASMQVLVNCENELNEFGMDSIDFLFNANKSEKHLPIRKVASGGELSRLMLCVKSLVAQHIDLATLVFDEIDSGISGEAAKQVGILLKELATKRQVICITHQPQIAGKADAHFFVYKEFVNDVIKANIRKLNSEERVNAIAKMIGGDKPTVAAIANAREMVLHETDNK